MDEDNTLAVEEVIVDLLTQIANNGEGSQDVLTHRQIRLYAWSIQKTMINNPLDYPEKEQREIIYWVVLLASYGVTIAKRSDIATLILEIFKRMKQKKKAKKKIN